ncbi:bifunctional glycerol-3-phosphate/glycerone-phosphate O-acyltransferase GPT2 Ecym_5484 [Eremothecium cymbalariae DBVPG|uniref:Phospholipid/glycerol acyltransferase domain-containing protein n=1 Tax=Eremothecium cymbalariae (strain CBS 270.75 / DBVPG 7215 / KCTC 17166 / NRRL Y-17582) TaxID=931890 RepID=I6NDT7_ERECY|nr:hypothetical protein Ecym_5484 [Eremothecium cymbalariae DBVPG\
MAVHVPEVDKSYINPYSGYCYNLHTFLYDFTVLAFDVVFKIFFREIQVRGSYNIPPKGNPTIVVCAPHANQFVDPALVMSQIFMLPGVQSRRPCFVAAASSFKKAFVGLFGRWTGGIPVDRSVDNLKPVDPNMVLYCPDYDNDPLTYKVRSKDPDVAIPDLRDIFTPKSLLGLPNYLSNTQIAFIQDHETIVLMKPFKNSVQVRELVVGGTHFKYASNVNNSVVFQNVFNNLHTKGLVGIFSEGGSHDRPSLLPIKAGVAIMALGAVAADPTLPITIVPCGLNYFHRNKFRSRAVLEFGEPIIVDEAAGKAYIEDPRKAVSELLEHVTNALYSVTVNAEDYETLMLIQATRRLYQPKTINGRIPLSLVVEMNRRLLIGYTKYKNLPKVQQLMKGVKEYNDQLYSLGLRDHQVEQLKTSNEAMMHTLFTFLRRLYQVFIFTILSLPGAILFVPIFITCHYYSQKKASEGVKKSFVKIKGDDLLATWKLFVALIMAPTLYITYSLALTIISSRYTNFDSISDKIRLFFYYYILLFCTTYASFRIGERGMDIFKSLPPLLISLIYPSRKIEELKHLRRSLCSEVTEVVGEFGPKLFPDLDSDEDSALSDNVSESDYNYEDLSANDSTYSRVHSASTTSQLSNAVSKINSRGSLADIPIFGDGYIDQLPGAPEDLEFEYKETPSSKIASLILQTRGTKEKPTSLMAIKVLVTM